MPLWKSIFNTPDICNISLLKNLAMVDERRQKMSTRREEEKFENNFSHFKRRKRNLNLFSPVTRTEREF